MGRWQGHAGGKAGIRKVVNDAGNPIRRAAATDYLLDCLFDGCIRVKTRSLRLGGVVAAKPLLILKQISFPANGGLLPDIRHLEI